MAAEKKKGKGKIVRNIILVLAGAGVVGGIAITSQGARNTVTTVQTARIETGDIDQVVSISGTVMTDETKTFYVDQAVEVATVAVKVGDEVKEGDVLITYNEEKLDSAVKQAKLSKQQAAGSYADTTYYSNKVYEEYGLASFKTVDEQIDHIDDMIDEIQQKITAKQQRYTDTALEFEKYTQDYDENGQAGIQDYTDEIMEKQLIMQRAMSDNQYAMQNDSEIRSWNRQIEELNQLKSDLSQTHLTDGAKSAASASKQLTDITANETIDSMEKLREGVVAAFNGVVTSVAAAEGMTTTPGQNLLTMQSTDDVKVVVNVTKYDMEKVKVGQSVTLTISGKTYEGKVRKIARTAGKNDRGGTIVETEIELLHPDADIILGMEADADIATASKKNVVLVPMEAVNVDSKGSFVYCLENGIVVRKDIETGIASDMMEEVISGLFAGDEVLTNITGDIEEGMQAQSAEVQEEEE